jgi:hypothetical protein
LSCLARPPLDRLQPCSGGLYTRFASVPDTVPAQLAPQLGRLPLRPLQHLVGRPTRLGQHRRRLAPRAPHTRSGSLELRLGCLLRGLRLGQRIGLLFLGAGYGGQRLLHRAVLSGEPAGGVGQDWLGQPQPLRDGEGLRLPGQADA